MQNISYLALISMHSNTMKILNECMSTHCTPRYCLHSYTWWAYMISLLFGWADFFFPFENPILLFFSSNFLFNKNHHHKIRSLGENVRELEIIAEHNNGKWQTTPAQQQQQQQQRSNRRSSKSSMCTMKSWSSFLQFWWELSNECNINTTVVAVRPRSLFSVLLTVHEVVSQWVKQCQRRA